MRKRTLHIENFGPISNATVELRTINMFIGEQAIGKSTMAKLIAVFTDAISLYRLIKDDVDAWHSMLKDHNLLVYLDGKYQVVYEEIDDDWHLHVECSPEGISSSISTDGKVISDKTMIADEILRFSKSHNVGDSRFTGGDMDVNTRLDNVTNSIYIPAERIIYSVLTNLMPALALANATIPKNLLRFMVELGNAKSEYPRFDIPLLGIEFKHEATEDSIVIDQTHKNIPMTAASSGIQSLVPLMLVINYAVSKRYYTSYVIEEPECNLFPTKQVELFRYLLKTVKHLGRTLTVTTHSPYLLAAMNNILFAGMLAEKYGQGIKKYIDGILPDPYRLTLKECSVYSLGKDINGGMYCRSLLDDETGMIDYNSLDGVSETLGDEFDALQRTVMEYKSKLHE
ncbi:MAG: ATP-binding protein [Muribaculaceae bacterium]|nr:ATP-binding protein [Muribaculaceae bacterium]